MKSNNIIGKKIGKLTVIKYEDKDKYSRPRYLCKCDCGNDKIISNEYDKLY